MPLLMCVLVPSTSAGCWRKQPGHQYGRSWPYQLRTDGSAFVGSFSNVCEENSSDLWKISRLSMSRQMPALSPCKLHHKKVFEGLYKSSPHFLIALSIKDHTWEFLPKMQIMLSSSEGLTLSSIKYLTGYSCIVVVPLEISLLNSDPHKSKKLDESQFLSGVGWRGSGWIPFLT